MTAEAAAKAATEALQATMQAAKASSEAAKAAAEAVQVMVQAAKSASEAAKAAAEAVQATLQAAKASSEAAKEVAEAKARSEKWCNTQQDGTQVDDRRCSRNGTESDPESLSETHLQDEKNPPLHTLDGNCTPDVQNDMISGREKMKEIDEYKRADEEEWVFRQREFQIQAEEARCLKRKKAQSKRLLDLERRQKQRVEEVRESRKKDEEIIKLKEQLRVEIRKELDRLGPMYNDMASLLRALGIHEGAVFCAMPNEVHKAYRRALVKFHPSRAPRNDHRQQVEAEEKFKLISSLKEKFLP